MKVSKNWLKRAVYENVYRPYQSIKNTACIQIQYSTNPAGSEISDVFTGGVFDGWLRMRGKSIEKGGKVENQVLSNSQCGQY